MLIPFTASTLARTGVGFTAMNDALARQVTAEHPDGARTSTTG